MPIAAYLTEPNAPIYRLIVDILLDQQRVSLTGVGRDELAALVHERLAAIGPSGSGLVDSVDLPARMGQLTEWGVVDTWQDRAVRDEDFLRNRDRYQLTEAAARLHRAIADLDVEGAESTVAGLAPAVLAQQLDVFAAGLRGDAAEAAKAWSVLYNTTDTMSRSAATWQSRLAAALAGAPTMEKAAAAVEIITRYVELWGSGIDTFTPVITNQLDEISRIDADGWRAAALATVGAEADDDRLIAVVVDMHRTVDLIATWFAGPNAQAAALRGQMASAVAPLIRAQRTVAAVGGHVSRRRELLALAARLEAARSPDDAWDVWCAATGLFSAAHHQIASPEPGVSAPSFWVADPAPVEARLRRHGARAATGRPAHMPDRSDARRLARAAQVAANASAARLRHDLIAVTDRPLSQMQRLTEEQGIALIDILSHLAGGLAISGPGPVRVQTPDGVWVVEASPLDGLAVVHIGDGRLVHNDVHLRLQLQAEAS
jgi:uncharacterized protein (TIGR02677 family)